MSSITPSVYAKARAEIIALFGWNADSLSPDQTLRIDTATALRLALDDLQGRVVRGESSDVARMLTASEALARLLPPAVLATPPSEPREDPRQVMWQIYKQMRERGEISLKALPEGQSRIDELVAENERLKARLAGKTSEHSDVPTADITPPSELGNCYAGIRPGPDDPPRRSPPVIEGRAVPKPPGAPAAAAKIAHTIIAPRPVAPAYDYNRERGWRDHVLPTGEITSTPMSRGRWWGPV